MNTELDLLRRWLAEPGGGMISRPLARAAFGEILQEIDRLAGLRTDAEIQDGMSGDDAAQAMGEVIEWARRHSAVRPLPHTIYQHPDDHMQKAARALSHSENLSPELRGNGPDDAYAKLVDGFRRIKAAAGAVTPDPRFRRFIEGQDGERVEVTNIAGMAMQIDASMPDDTIAIVAPGAAPFFIVNMGPAAPNCRVCNGTGEVIEYPADEDERIVACSACGGTGEATAI